MSVAYRPWFATSLNKLEDYTPCVSIGSDSIVLYDKYYGSKRSKVMPITNRNTGLVSTQQASRIRYYINLLIDTARSKKVYSNTTKKYYSFKVNLITLTLPSKQIHPDKEVHNKVFKEFIRAWKRIAPELLYVYKAEVQDNGNLHYHLTTNTYIHYSKLRDMWNYYTNKLGYIDRCSVKSPNSTDVHSVKNIKSLAGYMVAYLSKKDIYTKKLKRYHKMYDKALGSTNRDECVLPKNYLINLKRKVQLKVWDCSKSLMIGKCSTEIESDELMNEIHKVLNVATDSTAKDWFLFVKIDKDIRKELKVIAKMYQEHIQKIRDHTRNQPHLYYE